MERVSHASSAWQGTALAVAALLLVEGLGGCVSTKYQLARKGTPPIEVLNIGFPPAPPLEPVLSALITYGGPGSWKRRALWDEYVVGFRNSGDTPVVIDSVALIDSSGAAVAPGTDPWALEKASLALEAQYRARGEAFVRGAGAGVLIVGVGAGAAAIGLSSMYIAPAAAGAVLAGIFVLPVYYVTVIGINHHNKKLVTVEFNRRRLPFPLTLQPGESRVGSLFFPTIRTPRALEVRTSSAGGASVASLPLDLLKGLHVPKPVASPLVAPHATP